MLLPGPGLHKFNQTSYRFLLPVHLLCHKPQKSMLARKLYEEQGNFGYADPAQQHMFPEVTAVTLLPSSQFSKSLLA